MTISSSNLINRICDSQKRLESNHWITVITVIPKESFPGNAKGSLQRELLQVEKTASCFTFLVHLVWRFIESGILTGYLATLEADSPQKRKSESRCRVVALEVLQLNRTKPQIIPITFDDNDRLQFIRGNSSATIH